MQPLMKDVSSLSKHDFTGQQAGIKGFDSQYECEKGKSSCIVEGSTRTSFTH